MKAWFLTIIYVAVFFAAVGTARAEDWRIFGSSGEVQVTPKGGKTVVINNEKGLMMKIATGSTIVVKGKGKVVVVSLKSRQAFEIGDNTTAIVEAAVIRAVSGAVTLKSGFAPPSGKDGKMGGIVMRGDGNLRSCLKALTPTNTTILALTPELRWENRCNGLSRVNLTILSDERVVHSAEVIPTSSYRIPENVLKEGSRYLWMVDGGASFDMSSGVFMVASGTERQEVLQRMKGMSSNATPEERIATIYFLSDRGFSELAREEVGKLRAAFPNAGGLSDLP